MPVAAEATVSIQGLEPVVDRVAGIASRVRNARPAMEIIADALEGHVGGVFNTQGASIGKPWKPLRPSTVRARRTRSGYYGRRVPRGAGPSGPVLVWSQRLKRSFARGGVAHIRRVSDSKLEWGSGVRYATFHQSTRARSRLPRRPMIEFRDDGGFQRREIVFQPFRLWIQGVPAGAIRTVMAARTRLPL